MILTKRYLTYWHQTNYYCAKLTDEQAKELLALFGEEPAPEPPYIWDEETIWHTIRKMTQA